MNDTTLESFRSPRNATGAVSAISGLLKKIGYLLTQELDFSEMAVGGASRMELGAVTWQFLTANQR